MKFENTTIDKTNSETSQIQNDIRVRPSETKPQTLESKLDLNDTRLQGDDSHVKLELEKKNIEKTDGYYTTYSERFDQTPTEKSKLGNWEGDRGESKFIPSNLAVQEKLKEFNIDGIEYKNALPDFDPVTYEKVTIENMTSNMFSTKDAEGNRIIGNYDQADEALTQKWNSEKKDGRYNWTKSDVKKWMDDNNLVRHENSDMKTVSYIPRIVHEACTHSGGRAECRKKETMTSGGGFDE